MDIRFSISNLGKNIRVPSYIGEGRIYGNTRVFMYQIPIGWNVKDGDIVMIEATPNNTCSGRVAGSAKPKKSNRKVNSAKVAGSRTRR